ncbi:hypothetical protein MBANPS3_008504 [Mucor bainieri]
MLVLLGCEPMQHTTSSDNEEQHTTPSDNEETAPLENEEQQPAPSDNEEQQPAPSDNEEQQTIDFRFVVDVSAGECALDDADDKAIEDEGKLKRQTKDALDEIIKLIIKRNKTLDNQLKAKLVKTEGSSSILIKKEKGNSSSGWERLIVHKNAKQDDIFTSIDVKSSVIKAIYNVGPDGNCGFRAVSYGIFADQSRWMKVKEDMLEQYLKFKDTLYRPLDQEQSVVDNEQQIMITRLQFTKSPCLAAEDQHLWFSSFLCP